MKHLQHQDAPSLYNAPQNHHSWVLLDSCGDVLTPRQRTIPLCLRGTEEAEYEMDPRTAARRGKPLICMKITLPAKPRAFSLGKTFLSQGGMWDDGAAPRAGGIPSAPVQFKPRIQHWKWILFRKGNKKETNKIKLN